MQFEGDLFLFRPSLVALGLQDHLEQQLSVLTRNDRRSVWVPPLDNAPVQLWNSGVYGSSYVFLTVHSEKPSPTLSLIVMVTRSPLIYGVS